jgi:transposase
MVQRRISEAQRWQIIGMHTTGMSFKAIGRQMGYHYTVVGRLVRKHAQANNVKDLPRSGRPRVTSDRDDRALQVWLDGCHLQPVRMGFSTTWLEFKDMAQDPLVRREPVSASCN